MRKSKFTTAITSIVLCGMLTVGFQPAAMARTAAQSVSQSRSGSAHGEAFQFSRAELVANAMPYLMQKAGYQVQPADRGLVQGLRQMFNGREDYLWDATLVKTGTGELEFSVTLPANDTRVSSGEIVLGVIEHGTLARAFVVNTESGSSRLALRLSAPDGSLVGTYQLGVTRSGWLKADRAQLMALASTLAPTLADGINLGGIFDKIIALLNEVLDLLYFVRDMVNMAICAVEEVEGWVRGVENCGWTNVHPGGGYIFNLIYCSVVETIHLYNDIFSRCF